MDPIALQSSFSLLWPEGTTPAGTEVALGAKASRDIGVDTVIAILAQGDEQRKMLKQVMLRPVSDLAVIRYRQQVLADLSRFPAVAESLRALLPTLEALALDFYRREEREGSTLFEVVWRLGELESIVGCVQTLKRAFDSLDEPLQSAGLRTLKEQVERQASDPAFQRLEESLPAMLQQMRSSQSITVGINLDHHLQPTEAVLLAVNEKKFREGGLLTRLLPGAGRQWQGIAPLHQRSGNQGATMIGAPVPLPAPPSGNLMMEPLFRDLAQTLERVSQPIAQALQEHNRVRGELFANLYRELLFYLAGLRLVERLRAAGLPVCQPKPAPIDDRLCQMEESYNVALALNLLTGYQARDLRGQVVTNPVFLGPDEGRIQILTGPNRGGKTTYIQAVGLAQLLFQVGLFVPGSRARISPVDGIYTHFPVEEELERGTGRFGDEVQRLKEIFSQATRYSLLLLNESLTSTSVGESLYLARDLLRIMRRLGLRALFTTHMHELASNLERLNDQSPGDSRVSSVVVSRIEEAGDESTGDDIERSYRVRPAPPIGRSFARELARRYGISYEQLLDSLQERGVISKANHVSSNSSSDDREMRPQPDGLGKSACD